MDTKEYAQRIKDKINNEAIRQQSRQLEPHLPDEALTQALATKTAIFNEDDARFIEELVRDKKRNAQLRAAAVTRLGFGDDARVDLAELITLLEDSKEAPEVKVQAILKLEDAAFERLDFEDHRPDYLSALRSCLSSKSEDLIYTVMTTLSANKDTYAQELLLEWVENEKQSKLPTATVLQLLSNDIHAGLHKVAKRVLDNTKDENTRIEALRILASDGESYDYFQSLIKDNAASVEARQIAAVALKSLNPKQFEKQALSIVGDEDEDDTLRATVLSGLAHSADFNSNKSLQAKVKSACASDKSTYIKSMVDKHLSRAHQQEAIDADDYQ